MKKSRNTPAICRKSYVHPEVLTAYMSGEFVDMIEAKIAQKFKKQYAQLTPIMVLAFLHMRLAALKAADSGS
jgi:DNA topoisomerase-1